jgi:hypothetical protein
LSRRSLPAVAAGLAATLALAPSAAADQVIPDDLIAQGSICAGPDCVNNESFGFDTLRLKGPVLRVGFADTSSSPGFPTTDWQLIANDADGSGTASYFAFGDATAGTTPLRIAAGAPTDTLRVEADGTVRLGSGPLVQQVDGTTTEGAVPVDGAAIVASLGSLPIARYEYTADPADRKRLGPTAADFNTAFGVGAGADLAPADVAGAALAAAKQLSAQVESLEGPAGPAGPTGPKGDRGADGADAVVPAPSTAFDDAVAKLGGLERSDRRLRKRNRKLRNRVAQLERQVRTLRQDG